MQAFHRSQVKRYQGTTEYQKIISDEEINQGNISSSQFLSADDDLTSDDLEGWKRGNIIGKVCRRTFKTFFQAFGEVGFSTGGGEGQ